MSTERPRVLLAITVYNGEAFVTRTLESAAHISQDEVDVDVLILDDCSPAPGWSKRLAVLAEGYGFEYYRSPRNLGIPRNVNLGLLAAVRGGYDHVIISNSDVIYPQNVVSQLVRAAQDERIGSVTAWSNNVSIYSLPNLDPDLHLADQAVVDWLSATLEGQFGDARMDIPAGISFCVLIPTKVISDVGIMDPVFGRGYCEETDWSLRSLAAGYRIALAPGTFVYHAGRGSNLSAGLVTHDQTSVPENEAIIDMRYPLFRSQVEAFASSGLLEQAHKNAIAGIVGAAGRQYGYSVEVGWLPRVSRDDDHARCIVSPDGSGPAVALEFRGFRESLEAPGDVAENIRDFFGGAEPSELNLFDRGPITEELRATYAGKTRVNQRHNYPGRV